MKRIFLLSYFIFLTFFTLQSQNAPGYKSLYNKGMVKLDPKPLNGKKGKTYFDTYNWKAKQEFDTLVFKKKEAITELELAIQNPKNADRIKSAVDDLEKRKDKLEQELEDLRDSRDNYYRKYMREFIDNSNFLFFRFGPARSRAFFDRLYGNKEDTSFKLFANTGFNIGDNSGAIYSEIVSDQLWIFRVSLLTSITSSADDNQEDARKEEAFQRLIVAGGNTALKFEYPLAMLNNNKNGINFISIAVVRGAADFEQLGTNTTDWAGNVAAGIQGHLDFATVEGKLRFFASANVLGVWGNDMFTTNLGVDKEIFSLGQLKLGLVVNDFLSLSFVVGTWSSEGTLHNKSVVAGAQLLN